MRKEQDTTSTTMAPHASPAAAMRIPHTIPTATASKDFNQEKTVYLVRHSEATHNIKEREAVQEAIAKKGELCEIEREKARKSVLLSPALRDAPLSPDGYLHARKCSARLVSLTQAGNPIYQPAQIVLVSPLRRALMTATELFFNSDESLLPNQPKPRFYAIEILREKRTGYACDETSDVQTLKAEFPHVDFSDVERGLSIIPIGEDNEAVRARARAFLDDYLRQVTENFVAIVTHKGWLRELRQNLKSWEEQGTLKTDFDLGANWHQILYDNTEIRAAEFRWEQNILTSIVSRSVDNAISSSGVTSSTNGTEKAGRDT